MYAIGLTETGAQLFSFLPAGHEEAWTAAVMTWLRQFCRQALVMIRRCFALLLSSPHHSAQPDMYSFTCFYMGLLAVEFLSHFLAYIHAQTVSSYLG